MFTLLGSFRNCCLNSNRILLMSSYILYTADEIIWITKLQLDCRHSSFILFPWLGLLVIDLSGSGEKRSALLAEVARLREERSADPGEDGEYVSQQACRGTVSITKIQLPLKVEFVCSSHKRTGSTLPHILHLFWCICMISIWGKRFKNAELNQNYSGWQLLWNDWLVYVTMQVGQVTTFSCWSATGPATSSPPRWPRLLMLRTETPSPSRPLSLCKLLPGHSIRLIPCSFSQG